MLIIFSYLLQGSYRISPLNREENPIWSVRFFSAFTETNIELICQLNTITLKDRFEEAGPCNKEDSKSMLTSEENDDNIIALTFIAVTGIMITLHLLLCKLTV